MTDKLETKPASRNVFSYQKHETYFLEDVYIVVDNTMFKVPRLYLQESPVFQALLGGNPIDEGTPESKTMGDGTVHKPLVCSSVTVESVALLLCVLYPTSFNQAPKLTAYEWRDILELASKWNLEKIRDLAVQRLCGMRLDAITRLELARRHDIQRKEWLLPPIRELVREDERLTEADAMLIGVEMALRIARVQGMAHGQDAPAQPTPPRTFAAFGVPAPSAFGTANSPSSNGKDNNDIYIQKEFPEEFDEAPQFTVDEWRDVLELSLKWRLDKLHNLAILRLSNMQLDAVTKLELARRHGIQGKEWLLPAIQALVKEDKQLTEEEATIIGIKTAMKITRVQGMAHSRNTHAPSTTAFFGLSFLQGSWASPPSKSLREIDSQDGYIRKELPELF
ncbi:hypothetical protein AX17_006111 [Amanita inopinata Kibby_2008]|nr:hypothetical protein AX17_006111 [Amanita inopinata Kibby_2008]